MASISMSRSSRMREMVREAVRKERVGDVVRRGGKKEEEGSRRPSPWLVEVPYTATVSDTLHTMRAHNILAVAVAAPPGHWLGAGGSTIIQSDPSTGTPRKQYIGFVSTIDILMHLSENQSHPCSPQKLDETLLSSPVSSIIGHSSEGLSLWSFSPHTTVFEALEPFSKGIHRALVALQSPHGCVHGVETDIVSSSFTMLTQTDLVYFLHKILGEARREFDGDQNDNFALCSVETLGVVNGNIFGVSAHMPLLHTLKCMSKSSLSAVAILDVGTLQQPELIPAKGKKIVATFSASDLRGFSAEAFQCWKDQSVLSVVHRAQIMRRFGGIGSSVLGSMTSSTESAVAKPKLGDQVAPHHHDPWMIKSWDSTSYQEFKMLQQHQVTCFLSSPLEKVIAEALEARVHRVWVVENGSNDILVGVIAFSDILRVLRQYCV